MNTPYDMSNFGTIMNPTQQASAYQSPGFGATLPQGSTGGMNMGGLMQLLQMMKMGQMGQQGQQTNPAMTQRPPMPNPQIPQGGQPMGGLASALGGMYPQRPTTGIPGRRMGG